MIAVVGDIIRDRWVYAHWTKIGPEGPQALIDREVESPGGASNVAQNILALGAECRLFGHRPEIPIKTRITIDGQRLPRLDKETIHQLPQPLAEQVLEQVKASKPSVIVISDYAKGFCTPWLCQALIGLGLVTIVDPKGNDWSKYKGAFVICPNEQEALAAGPALKDFPLVVLTRGANGMRVKRSSSPDVDIPAIAHEVFDVAGAGDTVVAALAVALSEGHDLLEAARRANAAASVTVQKRGTAVCTRQELEAALSASRTAVSISRTRDTGTS